MCIACLLKPILTCLKTVVPWNTLVKRCAGLCWMLLHKKKRKYLRHSHLRGGGKGILNEWQFTRFTVGAPLLFSTTRIKLKWERERVKIEAGIRSNFASPTYYSSLCWISWYTLLQNYWRVLKKYIVKVYFLIKL